MSFLILSSVFLFMGRSILGSDRRETMAEIADEISDTAAIYDSYAERSGEGGFRGWRSMELRILLSATARSSGYHVFLCDANGEVVSCSEPPDACLHTGRVIAQQSLALALRAGDAGAFSDLGGFYERRRFIIAAPIRWDADGAALGYVFVAADDSYFSGAWSSFRQVFFFAVIIVLLLAVAMSFWASKRMAKPLNEMAAASRRFAHGDFSARVEIDDRDDEIGALTESFNAMAESLERSEERRSEFIANVSHELRTPMTTIAGFADGILDGTIPPENQARYLQTISTETKRLSRLVRRMLELSKFQEEDKLALLSREFDVRETLTRTLLSFEDKIRSRPLEAEVLIPEESVIVRGDGDAIEQVVYNLLENAIKFSTPGSTLTLSLWKQGDKACVSVKNQGETIDAAELNRVFDRFHKTDRSRSRDRDGVGLGLYIVKSILGNHDEDIYVTSREGVTEFVFTLALKEKSR